MGEKGIGIFWYFFRDFCSRVFGMILGFFRISGLPRPGQDVDFSEN